MLQNSPFYWGSVRKVVESFGVVFSDLHIVRSRADGTPYQTLEVPIEYGPKEKWLVRNTQNPMPSVDDPVEMVLPRMSYEMTGWQYDSSRKLTSTGRTVQALTNNNQVLKAQFNPVPYNFGFDLHIMAKNVEDGLMIVEQILPFFGPEYTISANDMPELELEKDIVIVHNGAVQTEDTWEGSFQDRRTITWSMNFTVKAYLYPPVKLTKVNLETDVYYRIDGGSNDPSILPSFGTVPNPITANATNIRNTTETRIDKRVVVISNPMSAVLTGGDGAIFIVTILNTINPVFTANVPSTAQSVNDTYSIDTVHGTFTYTAGVGARTTQETFSIDLIPMADPKQKITIKLVLNP